MSLYVSARASRAGSMSRHSYRSLLATPARSPRRVSGTGRLGASARSRTTAPLARALLPGEHATHSRALDSTVADLDVARTVALAHLKILNADWRDHLPKLATLQAELSYFEKWTAQLRDSHLELALTSNPQSP